MKEGTISPCAHRGTIILDASAIMALAKPVAADCTNGRADFSDTFSCLELLALLGRQGYRILIPEMVSLEVSHIMANGANISRIFPAESRYFYKSKLDVATQEQCRTFLIKASRGEYPNIQIIPNTGPEHVDAYCRQLQTISTTAKETTGNCPRQYNRGLPHDYKKTLARQLIHSAHMLPKKDFGDKAIMALTHDIAHTSREEILVLTRDRGLIKDINSLGKELPLVEALTSRQLLYMAKDVGLFPSIGIKEHTDPLQLLSQTTASAKKKSLHCIPAEGRNYAPCFYATLQNIAATLEHLTPPPPASSSPASEGKRRFADRYSKFFPEASQGQGR